MIRAGLIQLNSGDDPRENIAATTALIEEAAEGGANFVLTPEVTNCVSNSRKWQEKVLREERDDETLAALRALALRRKLWLLIGSLALKSGDSDGRFANRSLLIAPDGEVAARYDKIHMFDVDISETESYRESAGYRPGTRAVLAEMPLGKIGMTICYDLRFPLLYRKLAEAGATVLTVPSAFSPATGKAHWETLLRARAIENGAYVLAPAQCGTHPVSGSSGAPRRTHGHSLAVSPWGEVLADGGDAPGVRLVELDPSEVLNARKRIPSLAHNRNFSGP